MYVDHSTILNSQSKTGKAMSVEIVTKEEFQKGLDDLEYRLRTDITKEVRKILTEELPVILERRFVSKQALAEAAK